MLISSVMKQQLLHSYIKRSRIHISGTEQTQHLGNSMKLYSSHLITPDSSSVFHGDLNICNHKVYGGRFREGSLVPGLFALETINFCLDFPHMSYTSIHTQTLKLSRLSKYLLRYSSESELNSLSSPRETAQQDTYHSYNKTEHLEAELDH